MPHHPVGLTRVIRAPNAGIDAGDRRAPAGPRFHHSVCRSSGPTIFRPFFRHVYFAVFLALHAVRRANCAGGCGWDLALRTGPDESHRAPPRCRRHRAEFFRRHFNFPRADLLRRDASARAAGSRGTRAVRIRIRAHRRQVIPRFGRTCGRRVVAAGRTRRGSTTEFLRARRASAFDSQTFFTVCCRPSAARDSLEPSRGRHRGAWRFIRASQSGFANRPCFTFDASSARQALH